MVGRPLCGGFGLFGLIVFAGLWWLFGVLWYVAWGSGRSVCLRFGFGWGDW